MEDITRAQFLCDASLKTPVFTRFSTVAGSRGSADAVRDVRGFATKFYTAEGNFDLVGNNMPVFFIQDAIKFLDFVHAVKPEPHNEIPQAASVHDTLWDFVSLQPETMHMMMWLLSVGNVVPGIDFTNDPLLQGRLFSYLDTQLQGLAGPTSRKSRSIGRSPRTQSSTGWVRPADNSDRTRAIIPTASVADVLSWPLREKGTHTTPSEWTATRSAPAAIALKTTTVRRQCF